MCFRLEDLDAPRIVKAYVNSGFEPAYGLFGDGKTCGCALIALAIDTFPDYSVERLFEAIEDGEPGIVDYLEIDDRHRAFIAGFDGVRAKAFTEEQLEFYFAGVNARNAVHFHFNQEHSTAGLPVVMQ